VRLLLVVVALALAAAPPAGAKTFAAVAVVGADGSSVTLRPAPRVVSEFFDGHGSAAVRGGFVRVYPLGHTGHVGVPGRFYPETGALCLSWKQARPAARRCGLPGPGLWRLLLAAAERPLFHGTGAAVARLESAHVRPATFGNLGAAFELAFDRSALARPAPRPPSCLPFTATWRGGARPRRLCLSEQGAHAGGLLYPLGVEPFRLAWQNRTADPSPVELVPLAADRVAHCRRAAALRPVCPRFVPRVRAPYLGHLTTRAPIHFSLERGGERPQHPERNRPPAMAHLVVAVGRVGLIAPVWSLGRRREWVRDGLMRRPRTHTLALGSVTWGGRTGGLTLSPPYLRGGMLGNHLNFRWRAEGEEYLVSLHAREPLTEAVATLRAIVESLPPAQPPRPHHAK
jgi:hypothetical protein